MSLWGYAYAAMPVGLPSYQAEQRRQHRLKGVERLNETSHMVGESNRGAKAGAVYSSVNAARILRARKHGSTTVISAAHIWNSGMHSTCLPNGSSQETNHLGRIHNPETNHPARLINPETNLNKKGTGTLPCSIYSSDTIIWEDKSPFGRLIKENVLMAAATNKEPFPFIVGP